MSKTIPNNYAFIDANNLHLGSRSEHIRINYAKLRLHLRNRFHVSKAFMFIGYDLQHKKLYQKLCNCGFELVFKPIVPIYRAGTVVLKGNVDAELVLWAAAVEYDHYDQAVVVTGDGDFACLINFLRQRGKFRRLITPSHKFSTLLKCYGNDITTLSSIKRKIT